MASQGIQPKGPTYEVPVGKLTETFNVREKLNPERIAYFVDQYTSGEEVPPIELIKGTTEIFDGRHRKAALLQLATKMAACRSVEVSSDEQKFVEAFARNFGGPLPPTTSDIVHTMHEMLKVGVAQSRIKAQFAPRFMRPSHADHMLKQALKQIEEQKVARAASAVVSQDITVKDAAKKFGVDVGDVKAKLSGKKKLKRDASDIGKFKTDLGNVFKGQSKRVSTIMSRALNLFQDGEASEAKVSGVIDHLEKLLRKQLDEKIPGWRKDLEAKKKERAKAKA